MSEALSMHVLVVGANDPHNLPLDAEPATVRQDLDRLRT
jgi:hypothetical protein